MKAITFSDVLISPQYSDKESRRDADISSVLGTNSLLLPIISANMKSITGAEMAIEMRRQGGLGILHRFNTKVEALQEFKKTHDAGFACGVSIGVQETDRERFADLYFAGARIFCIDVAHGHSKLVKETIQWIRKQNIKYSKDLYIIAGNVATADGAYDLVDWGADCVKVGIGSGSICFTRRNCGVGVPQLYALQQIKEHLTLQGKKNIKIIADGGITCVGDICKALKYADAVMVGSFISGTTETPGKVFKDENDKYYKVYAGSASAENKESYGAPADFIEGITKKVPFRGHVKYILKEIEEGIKLSFGYLGAENIEEFRRRCEFIEISSGGRIESKI